MADIEQLFDTLLSLQKQKRLPPLEQWQPAKRGQVDIRIDREGRWFHEGDEIKRQPLIDLFATLLRKEGSDYFLVTPVEQMQITVEDSPFVVVGVVAVCTAVEFGVIRCDQQGRAPVLVRRQINKHAACLRSKSGAP